MKDVQATVRRIDEEITGHRQNIAASQVQIMRLEDTRRVLMGIAESDMAQADAVRHEERQMVINGPGSGPVLIVRKTGSGNEPEPPKPKRVDKRPHSRSRHSGDYKPGEFSEKLLYLLRLSPGGMKSRDVMLALDEPTASQRVYQTLHFMLKKGILARDDTGTYTVVANPPPPPPKNMEAEELKDRIHAALKTFDEPRPSGDIIKAALGVQFVEKGLKDRCYWALRVLKDKGLAVQQGGLYRATTVQ